MRMRRSQYGTSSLLQLLDDDTPCTKNRVKKMRTERLKNVAAQKKLLNDLSALQELLQHDHPYSNLTVTSDSCNNLTFEMPIEIQQDLVSRCIHRNHVSLSPKACVQVEINTLVQSQSETS